MIFKFRKADLPFEPKEAFNTTDISVDIICRIYLSEAPDSKCKKLAKKADEKAYDPNYFFIESIAGKNEPDGPILTSGWYLYYKTKKGKNVELGYVDDDIEGAWEFFQKDLDINIPSKN
jgi:glucan-binding YG repeat protein